MTPRRSCHYHPGKCMHVKKKLYNFLLQVRNEDAQRNKYVSIHQKMDEWMNSLRQNKENNHKISPLQGNSWVGVLFGKQFYKEGLFSSSGFLLIIVLYSRRPEEGRAIHTNVHAIEIQQVWWILGQPRSQRSSQLLMWEKNSKFK